SSSSTSNSEFSVETQTNGFGTISPTEVILNSGESAQFTVEADSGYVIDTVSGCSGVLSQGVYSITEVDSDCLVEVIFRKRYGSPEDEIVGGRYQVNQSDNGIVKDLETGLEWRRCAEGQVWEGADCSGQAVRFYSGDLNQIDENTDWRIPTREELKSLVRCGSGSLQYWDDVGTSCVENWESPEHLEAVFPGIS